MKAVWLSCLLVVSSLGADFTVMHQGVSMNVRTVLQTNWSYYTNTFDAYYGWCDGSNGMSSGIKTFPREVTLVGVVSSNSICDVIYQRDVKSSTVLSSNMIGYYLITSRTQVVQETNFLLKPLDKKTRFR